MSVCAAAAVSDRMVGKNKKDGKEKREKEGETV